MSLRATMSHRHPTHRTDTGNASAPAVSAVILAAGKSSRMGFPKGLLPLGGQSFIATIAESFVAAGVQREAISVVVDRRAFNTINEVERLGLRAQRITPSDRFASIRHAASVARAHTPTGCMPLVVLAPVDCPAVAPMTIRRLLAEAVDRPGHTLIPSWRGRGGHPVVLPAPVLEAIETAPTGANLRLITAQGPVSRVVVPDPHVLDNINTPADHARLSRLVNARTAERRARVAT